MGIPDRETHFAPQPQANRAGGGRAARIAVPDRIHREPRCRAAPHPGRGGHRRCRIPSGPVRRWHAVVLYPRRRAKGQGGSREPAFRRLHVGPADRPLGPLRFRPPARRPVQPVLRIRWRLHFRGQPVPLPRHQDAGPGQPRKHRPLLHPLLVVRRHRGGACLLVDGSRTSQQPEHAGRMGKPACH